MALGILALTGALLGVGSHTCYFIRGEHHRSNVEIFFSVLLGPPIISLYFWLVRGFSGAESVVATTTLVGAFFCSLTISILTYRCFFHTLHRFPGPVAAKLSKWWQVKRTIAEVNTFELLDQLHATYGDVVRSGPNELSIIVPEVVDAVFGPGSKCSKGVWYDMSVPITSLQQLRDRALHDRRKRQGWDKAFSMKSVRAYDDRVIRYADSLLENLNSFAGRPVNVSKWFNYFSYDVMGSLGFGQSFDMLKTGGSPKFIHILQEGTRILSFAGCIVYVCNLASKIPGAMNPITVINDYSEQRVMERMKNKSAEPDVIGHLIEAEEFFGDPTLDRMLLLGDSRLVIVAGSETTSTALVYTFFYIAKDPSIAEKVRKELQEHGIQDGASFSIPALHHLPYLNGVVYEGLRLHPPVPGGVFRISPPEGLHIGEHYIPGGVNLLVPTYTVHRSPKNFVDPNSFIPERWTTQPELVINKSALSPFSQGVYGCIGKHLAMGELRTVISKILLAFDVRLAPNETGAEMIGKQRDSFTLQPGKLELCFIKRGEMN